MYVIIKNGKTGHEQRIQKKAWEDYPHFYTGYHLATDEELESFEKVEEPKPKPPDINKIVEEKLKGQGKTDKVADNKVEGDKDKKSGKNKDPEVN